MKKLLPLLIIVAFMSACNHTEKSSNIIELEDSWLIKFGDNLSWAAPTLNEEDWIEINSFPTWEKQIEGYENYDGYAWYRISFLLPKELKENAYFGEQLQIYLGKIDNADQTFLNGILVGQNGVLANTSEPSQIIFEEDPDAYRYERRYIIPVDDSKIHWGQKNVIAIRVYDDQGWGGLNSPHPFVSMIDIKDYLTIDIQSSPFEINGENYIKNITLKNSHEENDFSGKLSIAVKSQLNEDLIFKSTEQINIPAKSSTDHIFSFSAPQNQSYIIIYTYMNEDSHYPIQYTQLAPYILTPEENLEPKINGPSVFGVRPGRPIIYNIPVSGARPLSYSAKNLPNGVTIDSLNGFIRGKNWRKGDYPISLFVENNLGIDSITFTLKVGEKIQLTPPMGWNSWNCWGLSVSDEKVRESAKAMHESGLVNYGWSYINIDDGWEAEKRTSWGKLEANEKFPDMKGLADYVHSLGLKIGIYSSPGPLTCGAYLGSYEHELQDAWTWARWEIDYLKYDWCSYRNISPNKEDTVGLKKPYILMSKTLRGINRDIVLSICQYGMGDVSSWGASVGGQLWRTSHDIRDTWQSMSSIGFTQYKHSAYCKPGEFNDPDMMVLGKIGWGPNLHWTGLTPDEQYTHMSLWSLLSAPLLLGNDLSQLDDFTYSLLSNSEVIALNQDALCDQADRIYAQDSIQIWMKDLSDGSHALGFFNLAEVHKELTVTLNELHLPDTIAMRDLWRQQDLGILENEITVQIPPHGVVLLKISKH